MWISEAQASQSHQQNLNTSTGGWLITLQKIMLDKEIASMYHYRVPNKFREMLDI